VSPALAANPAAPVIISIGGAVSNTVTIAVAGLLQPEAKRAIYREPVIRRTTIRSRIGLFPLLD
jgi:hypothetical protein